MMAQFRMNCNCSDTYLEEQDHEKYKLQRSPPYTAQDIDFLSNDLQDRYHMEYCNRQESAVTEANFDHDQASHGCQPREPKSIVHKQSAEALKPRKLGLVNSLMKSIEPEDEGIHIWTERERRKKMRNMFSNLHSLLPNLPAKADKSSIVEEAITYIKTLEQSLYVLENQRLDRARATTTLEFDLSSPFHEMQQHRDVSAATMKSVSDAPVFYHPLISECCASRGFEPWTSRQYSRTVSTGSPPIDHCFFQTWSSPNVVLSVCGDDAHMMICSSPPKQGLLTTIFYTLEKHKVDVVTAHISSDSYRSMYMIHARAHAVVNGGDQFLESKATEEAFRSAAGELVFHLSS